MLAGLLTAPSYYAPTANLKRSQGRADVVIGLMQQQGYLTKAQADYARAHPATLSTVAQSRIGGYFADWVMDATPSYLGQHTTEDVDLYTTFDPAIQKAADDGLTEVLDTKLKDGSKVQAAIVVMSADGAVRAMVGGRKLRGVAGQFNRAIQARRQTGSAFKPFVYAAALDLGYRPDDTVVDAPLTIDVPGSGPWSPQNYERTFNGPVTLTTALKESLNVPAVKVARAVGLENVRKVASDFGLKSDLAMGPALALGVSESTLLTMTGAYAGILNGGSSVQPYGIRQLAIKGDSTPLMGKGGGIGERVVSERAARELIYMMSQVIDSGTGRRAKLPDRDAAGKTGTTQGARDAWFVGFTADYVAGVWMGYDDNTPLTGVTGGGLPAEIWHAVMTKIDQNDPPKPLPMLTPDQLGPRTDQGVNAPPPLAPQARARAQQPPGAGDTQANNILLDVLTRIFGGH